MRVLSTTLLCTLALSAGGLSQRSAEAAETITFPASDDLYTYTFYPYMFFEGDRVNGSRELPLETIESISGAIISRTEALYCPATVELYVEGNLVASFDHEPVQGEVTFDFGPVPVTIPLDNGQVSMALRRITPEMEGCGSIILVEDASTLTFDGVYMPGAQDGDGDGYASEDFGGKDCDDEDPLINPGAEERCNGLDDNCNGSIDEGAVATYYEDLDGDGYGTLESTQTGCGDVPAGYALESGDCDDRDDGTYPGASEFCDGADNDCDLIIDNRDVDEDGYVAEACGGGDCDDRDASINPEAEDIPGDGVDNDCDDIVDEGGTTGCSPNREGDSGGAFGALALLGLGVFARRRRA